MSKKKQINPAAKVSSQFKDYSRTNGEADDITHVYEEYAVMREVMNQSYPEFNNRTLKYFLDDNQKRANSYVPDRTSQGKEEWQANVFTPTTRNKIKAHIASIAKTPPEVNMSAFDTSNQIVVRQAEVMLNLVKASYVIGDSNPEVTIFLDGWDCAINGTKIKYDGYLKINHKVKLLKDYDLTTGEVTYEEKEELVADHPIELDVPVQNLLIKNPYLFNIQDQPALIWVDYYDEERFDFEFSNYKNAKFVPTQESLLTAGDQQLFFGDYWKARLGDKMKKMYEIVRYYNKTQDTYIIVANGVLLLSAPLLWGRKHKRYPFAKTIYEPFANSNFFWGNCLPNILMSEQDVENAFINSMTDKTYRTLVTPMLIGLNNRDAFDLEDEWVTGDTKIYVDDVNNVKPMPIPQINQSEIAMLKIIQGGMQNDSTDSVQSGASGSGSTAREIVIANERAEELKGLFFTLIKDLWLQKYRLRTLNLLMNYSKAQRIPILGEEGDKAYEEQYKTFHVPNVPLDSQGGKLGTLSIEVKKDQSQLSRPFDLARREESLKMQGKPTEIIQITSDYLDEYEYVIQIETDTMFQKSKALKMAMMSEKIQGVSTLFPEIFMANKQEFFKKYMEGYGDDPEKYLRNMQQAQPQPGGDMMSQLLGGGQGQPGAGAPPGSPPGGSGGQPMPMPPKGQQPLTRQIAQPTKSLPALVGM